MSPLRAPHPASRLVPFAAWLLVLAALVGVSARHASARRAEARAVRPLRRAAARVVGPELALFPSSRWLRHPTRAEPWAAFSDGPAMLDIDPAGAIAPPPRALFATWATPLVVRRHGRGPR